MSAGLWTSSCSLFVCKHKEPWGQKNFCVSSCWLSFGRTGCNSQLPDLRKYYWKPGLFIFYTFCFSVQSYVSNLWDCYHLNCMVPSTQTLTIWWRGRKTQLFLPFFPECQFLACLCICEHWEWRFKGHLALYSTHAFLVCFLLCYFFFPVVSGRCLC